MKIKFFFIAIIITSFSQIEAQNVTVEKSIFGIQTGILGAWLHNESRLSNTIALRTEIGFNGGFRLGYNSDLVYVFTPLIRAEPRWYYNLEKRSEKGKNTTNNSANFVALSISYFPDWFVISNETNVYTPNQITFIPKWAIKRTIGEHFTYEAGIGIGYGFAFEENLSGVAVDLHIRIGYTL